MMTPSSSNPPISSILDGRSWSIKDFIFGSSSSAPKLNFVHTSFKGFLALMFDESMVSLIAIPFMLTLVGKFILGWTNLDVI
ncbi:hypothetical protein IEQ34_003465 [Dendrobium chrysotoxum]|uniref:Uncharacterized protein n=1 Tax=Dendrobium chrysotoxum TaxID=161865 RepID=A0AAV7HHP9_DENCH|nr:hypothetical protein IEQ34_003465 [Dendrobium chrysotoxum]